MLAWVSGVRDWLVGHAWPVLAVGLAVALAMVFLSNDRGATGTRPDRRPGEYLYLDAQRTDAYLGQLKEGISSQREQASSAKRARSGKISAKDVVEIGASVEATTSITETVSSTAADRFYELENRLEDGFGDDDKMTPIDADDATGGCAALGAVREGGFVRVVNLRMMVPTFALPLSRVAHAAQFLVPKLQGTGVVVRRGRDSLLALAASRKASPLRNYVRSFGADPVVPVRAQILATPAGGRASTEARSCLQMLLLLRYSNLADAPALLTGRVTLVGKVIRRLTGSVSYFDVQTAVTYTRALQQTRNHRIRKVLRVPPGKSAKIVNAAARLNAPGAVILPIAIYK